MIVSWTPNKGLGLNLTTAGQDRGVTRWLTEVVETILFRCKIGVIDILLS